MLDIGLFLLSRESLQLLRFGVNNASLLKFLNLLHLMHFEVFINNIWSCKNTSIFNYKYWQSIKNYSKDQFVIKLGSLNFLNFHIM